MDDEQGLQQACENKHSFIDYAVELVDETMGDSLRKYLNRMWTDEMSQVFFLTYWNKSFSFIPQLTEEGELPSFLDDIDRCIEAHILVHGVG